MVIFHEMHDYLGWPLNCRPISQEFSMTLTQENSSFPITVFSISFWFGFLLESKSALSVQHQILFPWDEMGQRVKGKKKWMCGKRLEYLPEEMLGGKDPPPATGCEARMLFKNPALRNLERDFTPMVGKDPFKEIKMIINQMTCSLPAKRSWLFKERTTKSLQS